MFPAGGVTHKHVNFEMAVRMEELAWIFRDKNQIDNAIKKFQEATKYFT